MLYYPWSFTHSMGTGHEIPWPSYKIYKAFKFIDLCTGGRIMDPSIQFNKANCTGLSVKYGATHNRSACQREKTPLYK